MFTDTFPFDLSKKTSLKARFLSVNLKILSRYVTSSLFDGLDDHLLQTYKLNYRD